MEDFENFLETPVGIEPEQKAETKTITVNNDSKIVDPPKKEDPKAAEQKVQIRVEANEKGVLIGGNLDEQFRLATAYCQSGLMPKGLNTPQKVLVALQLCAELGLPPMTSISKICVINGSPNLFGELPLALVMKSGLLESIKEEIEVDKKNEPTKATCTVVRKGFKEPVVRPFSVEDAMYAGIWGKGVWASYPKRMMQMRARSQALKDAFPDVLLGIGVLEYDHNTINERVEIAPSSGASKLNAMAGISSKDVIETECKTVETEEHHDPAN